MGHMIGYKQVTIYVDPNVYEKVRSTAYMLGEDIYEFIGEAMAEAVDRRTTKAQRSVIESMVAQNIANGAARKKRR